MRDNLLHKRENFYKVRSHRRAMAWHGRKGRRCQPPAPATAGRSRLTSINDPEPAFRGLSPPLVRVRRPRHWRAPGDGGRLRLVDRARRLSEGDDRQRRRCRAASARLAAPGLPADVGAVSGSRVNRAFPGLVSMVFLTIGKRARNGLKEIESR